MRAGDSVALTEHGREGGHGSLAFTGEGAAVLPRQMCLSGAGTDTGTDAAPSWRHVGTRKVLRPVGAGTVLYGAQLIAGHLSAERDIEQAGKEDPAIATSGYPFLCNGYGKRMQSAETID